MTPQPDIFDELALELWRAGGMDNPIPDELTKEDRSVYPHKRVKFEARMMRETFGPMIKQAERKA